MKTRSVLAMVIIAQLGVALCAAQAAEPGKWVRHDMQFNYLPMTTTYSCSGLAHKLRTLLSVSGARDDTSVTTSGCTRGGGVPDKFARARLIFYTLQPLSGATGDTSKDGAIDGVWKTVQLSARPRMDIEIGDCELVEQYRQKILPAFSVRNITEPTPCVPFQRSSGGFSLKFDVFVKAQTQG